jgi:hypothetical protein
MPIPPDAPWDLGEDNLGKNTLKALQAAGITPAAADAMTREERSKIPGMGTARLARLAARLERMRTDANRAAAADPYRAFGIIGTAANRMRDVAGAVGTVGHNWTVNAPDGTYNWVIGDGSGIFVAETPDYGGLELPDHIASWTPPVALLVAELLDVVATDIRRTLEARGGRPLEHMPAEWTTACNLASAYLERFGGT